MARPRRPRLSSPGQGPRPASPQRSRNDCLAGRHPAACHPASRDQAHYGPVYPPTLIADHPAEPPAPPPSRIIPRAPPSSPGPSASRRILWSSAIALLLLLAVSAAVSRVRPTGERLPRAGTLKGHSDSVDSLAFQSRWPHPGLGECRQNHQALGCGQRTLACAPSRATRIRSFRRLQPRWPHLGLGGLRRPHHQAVGCGQRQLLRTASRGPHRYCQLRCLQPRWPHLGIGECRQSIKLWDAASGSCCAPLKDHRARPNP